MTYVSSGDVRFHVRILSTYVLYRRTCAIDVRVQSTYVFYWRTWFRDGRFRDYAVELEGFGTTLLERWIRDYAVGNRGVGTTQNTLDLMQNIAVDSFSGLRLAS